MVQPQNTCTKQGELKSKPHKTHKTFVHLLRGVLFSIWSRPPNNKHHYISYVFFYDSSRVLRNKRPHRKRKNFHAPPLPQFQCWLVKKRGTCILTSSGVYFAGPEHSKNNNPSTLKLGERGWETLWSVLPAGVFFAGHGTPWFFLFSRVISAGMIEYRSFTGWRFAQRFVRFVVQF